MGIFNGKNGKRQEQAEDSVGYDKGKINESPSMNVYFNAYKGERGDIAANGVWLKEYNGVLIHLEDGRGVVVFCTGEILRFDRDGKFIANEDVWKASIHSISSPEEGSTDISSGSDNRD